MPIAGKPVLQYILERLNTVIALDQVIIATSDERSDDPITLFAKKQGVKVYRGSLEKVALRFYEAAQELNCRYACRINGDNIFLDTEVLQHMLKAAFSRKYVFLSNVKGRTFPKGMSVEIVDMTYYAAQLPFILQNPYFTEHVMVYLYEQAEEEAHYYLKNTDLPEAAAVQMALDTKEDLHRSKWVIRQLDRPHTQVGMKEFLELLKSYEQRL